MKSLVVYKILIACGFGLAFIFCSATVYLWSSSNEQIAKIELLEKEVAELKAQEQERTVSKKAEPKSDLNKLFFSGGDEISERDNSKTYNTLFD